MKFVPTSIRVRVALYTCATLFVSLVAAAILIDAEVRDQALGALDDRLRSEADSITALTRFDGTKFEVDFEDEVMRTFSRAKNGAYFQVSARNGVIERSASLGDDLLPAPSLEFLDRAETNRTRHTERTTIERPNEPPLRLLTLYTLRRAMNGDDSDSPGSGVARALAVQVARSLSELDHPQEEVREAMAIVLPLAFLFGTICVFLAAGRATRRIKEMSDSAESIASGATTARLDAAEVDGELAMLAMTLNRAFDRLALQAERERQLSSIVAHELRTPISIARARIEVALSRERDAEEYKSALAITGSAVARLGALVESLLVLARAENSRYDSNRGHERCDLRAIASSAIEEARTAASTRGQENEIEVTLPASAVPVIGEPILLQRAIANLLHNALSHGAASSKGSEGAKPSLLLEVTNDRAVLTVRDHGPGFQDDLLPHLFDRFSRADVSRSRATGGAGLGLAITRAISVAHGGSATARNIPERGAEVRLDLPLAK